MTPYTPSEKSQRTIIDFSNSCCQLANMNWQIKQRLLEIDRAYMRETDLTEDQLKAKLANRRGDANKFQNIVLPVVMPQVEAAVTYQQSVFLSGYPIFSCVSVPEFADQASQMDTIIAEQQEYGNWVPEFQKCLRDGFKYNLMAMEVSWDKKVSYGLETDIGYADGQQGKPAEIIWEGNKLRRLDLYNTQWDTRVDPKDIAEKGEFVSFNDIMGRVRIKQFLQSLPTRINVREALESATVAPIGSIQPTGSNGYYFPKLNPEAIINTDTLISGTNWAAWAGYMQQDSSIRYSDIYLVTTLYGRILPSDFGFTNVPERNTPQVWKFIIVNNQVVVYAERLTNAHNLIPTVFAQPLDDGLAYQTKSLAVNVQPIQEITTALSNSSIASRRRAISDRMLYDPSRVSPGAINNDSPTAKIPVRPSAYQQELSRAVFPIPFRDDQFQINMAETQSFLAMANQISGLNPARQGQFVKGNKTKFEYADIMANANGRDQAVALVLEGNFFTPIKQIIKSNILQYQKGTAVYNREEERMVTVDPVALRKANLVFKISDGVNPSDKIIDGDTLTAATQLFSSVPQIGAEYNVGDMVAYLFKSRGLKLQSFKKSPEQVSYEQAIAQWQQAIQTLAEALVKGGATEQQLQVALQAIPQPTPEQFNYVPGRPTLTPGAATTPNSPTLLAGMEQTIQAATQPAASPAQSVPSSPGQSVPQQ